MMRHLHAEPPAEDIRGTAESADDSVVVVVPTSPAQPVLPDDDQAVGRNDPCWCGSGRKFKRWVLRSSWG